MANNNANAAMSLGDLGGDLSALLNEPEKSDQAPKNTGGPLDIDMDLIQEDPNQPRKENNPGFSQSSIAEIAASIRERGVKSPISLREVEGGGYIINHGARRFRGSKVAGKKTIPAFIDNDYNEADQVVENLQRNELTAREIADFIGRELAKGIKKGVIAKSIGKSAAFVTQHSTLLDLPDPIADAFNAGRVSDVTAINELVTLFKKWPDEVVLWLDEEQEISRASVKLLREFVELKSEEAAALVNEASVEGLEGEQEGDAESLGGDAELKPESATELKPESGGLACFADDYDRPAEDAEDAEDWTKESVGDDYKASRETNEKLAQASEEMWPDSDELDSGDLTSGVKETDPNVLKKPTIRVVHDDRLAILNFKRKPTSGHAWLKYEDDGYEFESDLNEFKIIAVGEL